MAMDPITASAIASSGASVANGIFGIGQGRANRKAQARNVERTIAANKEEAELAYQRSVEMWDRMNQYNTPEAQMNRFKDAGLNPHLIYGQGNAGNTSSPPQYQRPEMQYKYLANQDMGALQGVLPALMEAGTWMQNMKLTEAQISKTETDTEKSATAIELAQQTLSFLAEKYPKILKDLQNNLDLFPYQKDIQVADAQKAHTMVEGVINQFKQDWGQDPRTMYKPFFHTSQNTLQGGTKELDLIKKRLENSIKDSESKLKAAQASWADYGVTSPQALMQLVIGGLMGQAGIIMRNKGTIKPKVNSKLSRTITNVENTRRGKRIIKRNMYD